MLKVININSEIELCERNGGIDIARIEIPIIHIIFIICRFDIVINKKMFFEN